MLDNSQFWLRVFRAHMRGSLDLRVESRDAVVGGWNAKMVSA